ncbi:MAG TPA: helical backbone metal receptor [Steroidobacteraceae bacterium]|nr:helical backbone metal receptor [Steroidobacteraceae bacterium]
MIHRAHGAHALLAIALGLVLGGAPPPTRAAVVLRDDWQHEVTFTRPPLRIVSLLPSLTETVCALGACDRLVATDRYSDWPPEVRSLPKTGGLDDVEIETIVRLNPDLVLLSRSQRIADRLSELHVESFSLETQGYTAIARNVTMIGAILDLPERAAALNQRIDHSIREVSAQAHRRGTEPTVYFEVDPAPYAAAPESFIGELLSLLGTRNIVSSDLGPFPKLNPEYVVRHNPDVIFVSPAQAPHLAERPGWAEIRAVKEQRLCYFAPAVEAMLMRPGPRVADGMRAMADCLERVAP